MDQSVNLCALLRYLATTLQTSSSSLAAADCSSSERPGLATVGSYDSMHHGRQLNVSTDHKLMVLYLIYSRIAFC